MLRAGREKLECYELEGKISHILQVAYMPQDFALM